MSKDSAFLTVPSMTVSECARDVQQQETFLSLECAAIILILTTGTRANTLLLVSNAIARA